MFQGFQLQLQAFKSTWIFNWCSIFILVALLWLLVVSCHKLFSCIPTHVKDVNEYLLPRESPLKVVRTTHSQPSNPGMFYLYFVTRVTKTFWKLGAWQKIQSSRHKNSLKYEHVLQSAYNNPDCLYSMHPYAYIIIAFKWLQTMP